MPNTTTIVFQFLISLNGSALFTVTLFFVAPCISEAEILKVSTHQKQSTVYLFRVITMKTITRCWMLLDFAISTGRPTKC